MRTTRSTRSSVLGKRAHRLSENSSSSLCEQQLLTPESTPNPKRARLSTSVVDGDSNKENVPPFSTEILNAELVISRNSRELTRTATELIITPTRARPTTRRHVSTPIISTHTTPTRDISHLAISTPPPTPPTSLLPIHARARALLRSTCNNTNIQIAGRELERATIHDFLTSFIDVGSDDAESTSLYISGSPGTGKTALVNSVLNQLRTDAKVIFVNCMALNSIESLWERLIEELEGQKTKLTGRSKKIKGRDAIVRLLSVHQSKFVVVLDELDHITSTTQALASVFSLPNANPAILRLIGIANTHTLTSSSTTSSIMAASNVCTLHFAPYTPSQLLEILQSRLSPLFSDDNASDQEKPASSAKKFLPAPTLTLLTKKIAALTGDVRSLFEVLRSAVDLAVTSSTILPSSTEANPLNTPIPNVTPTHILAALKAYTPSSTSAPTAKAALTSKPTTTGASTSNSEIITKISNLGLQARLVLLSILLASKRLEVNLPLAVTATITSSPRKSPTSPIKRSTSLPTPAMISNGAGIESTQLHAYYSSVLDRSDNGGFEAVSRNEFGDLVGVLEGIGLISLGSASDTPINTSARRLLGRSTSFSGSAGFGGAGKGKGKGKGDIRLATGVRADEVLRGLGITATEVDIRGEEAKVIWERENARLARDLKAIERQKERAAVIANGFEDASED